MDGLLGFCLEAHDEEREGKMMIRSSCMHVGSLRGLFTRYPFPGSVGKLARSSFAIDG